MLAEDLNIQDLSLVMIQRIIYGGEMIKGMEADLINHVLNKMEILQKSAWRMSKCLKLCCESWSPEPSQKSETSLCTVFAVSKWLDGLGVDGGIRPYLARRAKRDWSVAQTHGACRPDRCAVVGQFSRDCWYFQARQGYEETPQDVSMVEELFGTQGDGNEI